MKVATLSNGARLCLDPMPGLETAAIGVWAHAGAMDETESENGIAHLLEHMAFKGTTTRSARTIAEMMENVGGYLNAATTYTSTGYYARVLKQDAQVAFELLGDILVDPAFAVEELEKEKDVVLQEIGEARDTPDDLVFELVQSLTYRDQPLGRSILGSPESVRRQDADDLRGFRRRHYGADNLVISVAGAFDEEETIAFAEAAFAPLNRDSKSSRMRRTVFTSGCAHEDKDLEQTHIALATPGCGVRDDAYFATRLFTEILGGGMSSRLYQRVREDEGLAYSVYAYLDSYDDIGSVGVYLGVDAENAEHALALCREEIVALGETINDAEFLRAKALLRSSLLMALESPLTRAERTAAQICAFDRAISARESLALLESVDLDDVKAAACRSAAFEDASLAVVGPASFAKLERHIRA